MASAFSHAVVALTVGKSLRSDVLNRSVLSWGALCSIVPDLDVVGFYWGVQYGDLWGHRGLTHSVLFAVLFSGLLAALGFQGKQAEERKRLFSYFFFCTASHGVLDALTDGGLGVAFFSPFDSTRYFFPVRPIVVSPIGIGEFFSHWGLQVLMSEMLWIWLPCGAVAVLLRVLQKGRLPAF